MNPTQFAEALRRRTRLATCVMASMSIAMTPVAALAAPSEPQGASAAAPPAVPLDDPGCLSPASSGGAAPPTLASAEVHVKVTHIVSPYRHSPLTPASATAIRAALCEAGLWRHPGLDQALAAWGLSAKQLEALTPAPAARPDQTASGNGRRVPPRE